MWFIRFKSRRAAPSVESQSLAQLLHWRALQRDDGHRILVGILAGGQTMRHTTPLKFIDPITRSWITQSGRRYQTVGAPTNDQLLMELQKRFVHECGIGGELNDVTDEIPPTMQHLLH
jgi:hypothetical protein